jgi:hypothetical protein
MSSRDHARLSAAIVAVVLCSGRAAAQTSAVVDLLTAPWYVRAGVTAVVVGVFGVVLTTQFDGGVEHARGLARPYSLRNFGYGLFAHLGILIFGVALVGMAASIPIAEASVVRDLVVVGVGAFYVTFSSLAFLVVGAVFAERAGWDSPWGGLVVGAVVAGVVLAVPVAGPLVWVAVVSVALGGLIDAWIHEGGGDSDRSDETIDDESAGND